MDTFGDFYSFHFGEWESSREDKAWLKVLRASVRDWIRHDVPSVAGRTAKRAASPASVAVEGLRVLRKQGLRKSVRQSAQLFSDSADHAKHMPKRLVKLARLLQVEVREGFREEPLIFLVSCTSLLVGLYLGNELPDQDWKLPKGFGAHRNIFFHSALSSAALVLVAKFFIRLCDNACAESRLESHAAMFREMRRQLTLIEGGTTFGVGVHLFVDGTFQGSCAVGNPFTGTFVYDTLWDDRAWLLMNSILSILHGTDAVFPNRPGALLKEFQSSS